MERAFEWPEDMPVPQVIIDGGGEQWAVLGEVIKSRLAQTTAGEVLEIISEEPRNRADIPAWCYLSGHDLLHMSTQGQRTRFWIRNGH